MSRVKVEYRTTSREVYEKFKAAHPEIHLGYKEWVMIIKAFNEGFRDYIAETGEKVKLPWGFGPITVTKKRTKKKVIRKSDGKEFIVMPTNWKKTKELGKAVYLMNSHTDGWRCKWIWFSWEARFYCPEIWVFKPSRLSSRKLAELINLDPNHMQIYKKWLKG